MPKFRLAMLGSVLVWLLWIGSSVAAQTRSVFWQRWDVTISNIDVTANRFDVSEYYDIQFTGTFRFGSAVIPLNNLEAIRNVQVFEAGQLLQMSCSGQPGTYCVENVTEGLSITYNFRQPLTNTRGQFEIRYSVIGALRIYAGGDQLWWTAIPAEHYGFPIGSSTITVQMPPGYGPREGLDPVVTYGAPGTIQVSGTTITARANRQIGGDEFFEIRVQYPHNPAARVPAWQAQFDERRLFEETTKPLIDLGVVALALLVGIGGVLGVYALWYTRGRDPKVGLVPEYLTEPPSQLPPGVVGTLLDEQVDLRDIMATILDLGQRGYLVIEESKSEGLFGIGKSSGFVFKRTDKPVNDLRKFEQRVIASVFPGNRMERSLASLRNSFYAVIPHLQDDLYEALVEDGLFTVKPSTTRTVWSIIGAGLFALALFAGLGALMLGEDISQTLLCLPAALTVVAVAAFVAGQQMPAKTPKGAEEAAKWRAFREFLANLEKYRDVRDSVVHFDDYLPYAVAFGLDRSWIRKFSQLDDVPVPRWYYPTYLGGPYRGGYRAGTPFPVEPRSTRAGLPGELARAGGSGVSLDRLSEGIGGGLEAISSGLTSLLEAASSAMTSRPEPPPATKGSSGSWSSGGRSWSGGGFRGGGSSGGGSRGFG